MESAVLLAVQGMDAIYSSKGAISAFKLYNSYKFTLKILNHALHLSDESLGVTLCG